MSFELFVERAHHAATPAPELTVQRNGTLAINAAAMQLLVGEGPDVDEVELLYDADTGAIGVRRHLGGPGRTHVLRTRGSMGSRHFGAKAFLVAHELLVDQAVRLQAGVVSHEGTVMLVATSAVPWAAATVGPEVEPEPEPPKPEVDEAARQEAAAQVAAEVAERRARRRRPEPEAEAEPEPQAAEPEAEPELQAAEPEPEPTVDQPSPGRRELLLRCQDCVFTAPVEESSRMFRHTQDAHGRRASSLERMPSDR